MCIRDRPDAGRQYGRGRERRRGGEYARGAGAVVADGGAAGAVRGGDVPGL